MNKLRHKKRPPNATYRRPFEVRFTDRFGWERIAQCPQLPVVMRVQAWTTCRLEYQTSYRPVSQAQVSRELGCSQAQVSRALATLREIGWLDATKVGREWRYRLAMEMGWKGTAEAYHAELAARAEFREFERMTREEKASPDDHPGTRDLMDVINEERERRARADEEAQARAKEWAEMESQPATAYLDRMLAQVRANRPHPMERPAAERDAGGATEEEKAELDATLKAYRKRSRSDDDGR